MHNSDNLGPNVGPSDKSSFGEPFNAGNQSEPNTIQNQTVVVTVKSENQTQQYIHLSEPITPIKIKIVKTEQVDLEDIVDLEDLLKRLEESSSTKTGQSEEGVQELKEDPLPSNDYLRKTPQPNELYLLLSELAEPLKQEVSESTSEEVATESEIEAAPESKADLGGTDIRLLRLQAEAQRYGSSLRVTEKGFVIGLLKKIPHLAQKGIDYTAKGIRKIRSIPIAESSLGVASAAMDLVFIPLSLYGQWRDRSNVKAHIRSLSTSGLEAKARQDFIKELRERIENAENPNDFNQPNALGINFILLDEKILRKNETDRASIKKAMLRALDNPRVANKLWVQHIIHKGNNFCANQSSLLKKSPDYPDFLFNLEKNYGVVIDSPKKQLQDYVTATNDTNPDIAPLILEIRRLELKKFPVPSEQDKQDPHFKVAFNRKKEIAENLEIFKEALSNLGIDLSEFSEDHIFNQIVYDEATFSKQVRFDFDSPFKENLIDQFIQQDSRSTQIDKMIERRKRLVEQKENNARAAFEPIFDELMPALQQGQGTSIDPFKGIQDKLTENGLLTAFINPPEAFVKSSESTEKEKEKEVETVEQSQGFIGRIVPKLVEKAHMQLKPKREDLIESLFRIRDEAHEFPSGELYFQVCAKRRLEGKELPAEFEFTDEQFFEELYEGNSDVQLLSEIFKYEASRAQDAFKRELYLHLSTVQDEDLAKLLYTQIFNQGDLNQQISETIGEMLTDGSIKPVLEKAYASHLDTMSASLRNGVQSLAQAKQITERKNNIFYYAKSIVTGTIGFFSAAFTIVGFILTMTGVLSIPGAASLALGIFFGAVSYTSSLSGYLYAYFTSPRRFIEETVKLKGLRSGFRRGGHSIAKYRYKRAKKQQFLNELNTYVITHKLEKGQFNPETLEQLKPYLKKDVYEVLKKNTWGEGESEILEKRLQGFVDEGEKVNAKVKRREERLHRASEKAGKLKSDVGLAGAKDFATKEKSADVLFADSSEDHKPTFAKALSQLHEVKGTDQQTGIEDLTGIDEDTQKALFNATGISVEELARRSQDEKRGLKELAQEEILDYMGGLFDKIAAASKAVKKSNK